MGGVPNIKKIYTLLTSKVWWGLFIKIRWGIEGGDWVGLDKSLLVFLTVDTLVIISKVIEDKTCLGLSYQSFELSFNFFIAEQRMFIFNFVFRCSLVFCFCFVMQTLSRISTRTRQSIPFHLFSNAISLVFHLFFSSEYVYSKRIRVILVLKAYVCARRCSGPSDRVDQNPGEGGCEACKFYLVAHQDVAPYPSTLAPVKCLPESGGFRVYFEKLSELRLAATASTSASGAGAGPADGQLPESGGGSGESDGERFRRSSDPVAEITGGIGADGEMLVGASNLQSQYCPYGFTYNQYWTSHSTKWVCIFCFDFQNSTASRFEILILFKVKCTPISRDKNELNTNQNLKQY